MLEQLLSLLGWNLATEKDAMFLACAHILGVVIDLACEMVVRICNTSKQGRAVQGNHVNP